MAKARKTPLRQVLIHTNSNGIETYVPLVDGLHLGKFAELQQNKGFLPAIYERARKATRVGYDNAVSPNHALIVQSADSWEIYDLRSTNGTLVIREGKEDNEIIPAPWQKDGIRLSQNDRIQLGDQQFLFHTEEVANGSALLVANPKNLDGIVTDVQQMQQFARHKLDFRTNIDTLFRYRATKDAVTCRLQQQARRSNDESMFLFYYSGHSEEDGLMLYDKPLSVMEFYQNLDRIRGAKLVILDCCDATSFLCQNSPGTMVLTAMSPKQRLYVGPVSGAFAIDDLRAIGNHNERREKIQSFFTRSFIRTLQGKVGEVHMRRIAEELESYSGLQHHDVAVFAEGTSVIFNLRDLRSENSV